MATCKSCGSPIRWAKHENTGSAMPLEPLEGVNAEGAFRLEEDESGQTWAVWIPPGGGSAVEAGGEQLYQSHFATCPDADEWRSS